MYVEDLWSATEKLNLTIGLRYDYDNLSKGGSDKGDYNNLAPESTANYSRQEAVSAPVMVLPTTKSITACTGDAFCSKHYFRRLPQTQQLINPVSCLPTPTFDAITFDGNIGASVSNVAYLQDRRRVPCRSSAKAPFPTNAGF